MEIVSRPDIRSAEQARAYVSELRSVLQAIGVSDVKMEEGSMRVDANVSVRPVGTTELGTKVEVKNMNSLRSLGRGDQYEIERQIGAIEAGERIVQETRHWDEADGRTHSMRTKEGSSDYRYFPEPDLVPVAPTDEMPARVRSSMPELPAARRARLQEEWGIGDTEARVLVATPGLAEYAEAAVLALDGGTARDVVNWSNGDVLGYLNESGCRPQCSARPRRARGARRHGRRRADLAQPGEGRAGRVPHRAEATEAGRRRARPVAGERRRCARRGGRRRPGRQRRRRRRLPGRRRQAPQEEARLPHGRGDEGAPTVRATRRSSTSSSTRSSPRDNRHTRAISLRHGSRRRNPRRNESAAHQLAAEQFGVINRVQALAAGLSSAAISRRIKRGTWERVLPGVYGVVGAPVSQQREITAAVLWAGEVR